GGGVETDLEYDAAEVPPFLSNSDLELHGDETHGVRLVGVVRDAEGAALVLCRLTGLPYADAVEAARAGRVELTRWLLVIGFAAGATAIWRAARGSPRRAAARLRTPVALAAAVFGLRALLAFLDLPAHRNGASLLNPAAFAMVGFGGVFRSPLDFAITAV